MDPFETLAHRSDGSRGGGRLVVAVAHPDDEAFGCGSIVLAARAAGLEVTLLCATRGEAGEVAPGVEVPADGLGALREQELHASAAVLGVARTVLLDLGDSGMDGDPAPGTLAAAPASDLVALVGSVVDEVRPLAVVTLDGGDGHRDHVAVRDAALAVAARAGLTTYLHCLPRSVMSRWAEHRATVDPGSAYLRGLELGTPDERVTHVLDTRAHLEARWRAIRAHRSQTSPFEGLPEELQALFLEQDHLVEVTA